MDYIYFKQNNYWSRYCRPKVYNIAILV